MKKYWLYSNNRIEKRLALLLLGLLLIGTACKIENDGSAKPMLIAEDMTAYLQNLADSLHAETIAVSFYDLETGQAFHHNEKTMLNAASTMKMPVTV